MTETKTKTSNLNKARQMLVDKYLEVLKQDEIPWNSPWYSTKPKNGITNKPYRGVNNLLLSLISDERKYKGCRWYTFNQISDRENKYHTNVTWHLKKGSKSVPVEYWMVFNTVEKKSYTFEQYTQIVKDDPEKDREFKLISRCYYVFNEDEIEGITPEVFPENNDIESSVFISNVIKNMGVGYEERGSRAYYSPVDDKVVVPSPKAFKSEYGFYATQLHELSHATGAKNRLDRHIENTFGTPDYAKEELRAEIGSSFLMQNFNLEYDDSHILNHSAYIQSWAGILESNPKELFAAIKDAEKIEKYIIEIGNRKEELVA